MRRRFSPELFPLVAVLTGSLGACAVGATDASLEHMEHDASTDARHEGGAGVSDAGKAHDGSAGSGGAGAGGGSDDAGGAAGSAGSREAGAGGGAIDAGGDGAKDASDESTADAGADAEETGSDAGSDGSDDAGADGGGSDGGSDDDPSCSSPNGCNSATSLQPISGDQDDTGPNPENTVRATGSSSKWFSVRVKEDNGAVYGRALKVTADLRSPDSANYDLYLYVNTARDILECSAKSGSSTKPAGQTDTVALTWGEGSISNGSDDARTVTIEVRHVSGPCDPAQPWDLSVHGH